VSADPDLYFVPAREHRHQHTEKGSKFIAVAAPAESVGRAEEILAGERRHYHDATHHCHAWRSEGQRHHSDDGEPAGTAGVPIARALDAAELEDAVVVVTRYFGGTKLGTGGLARAYGDAARAALAGAGREARYRTATVVVAFAHADTSAVHHAAGRFGARQIGAAYGEQAALRFELHRSKTGAFIEAVIEGTHGRARANVSSV
jgi:uncharacterized YigZ family protein